MRSSDNNAKVVVDLIGASCGHDGCLDGKIGCYSKWPGWQENSTSVTRYGRTNGSAVIIQFKLIIRSCNGIFDYDVSSGSHTNRDIGRVDRQITFRQRIHSQRNTVRVRASRRHNSLRQGIRDVGNRVEGRVRFR